MVFVGQQVLAVQVLHRPLDLVVHGVVHAQTARGAHEEVSVVQGQRAGAAQALQMARSEGASNGTSSSARSPRCGPRSR